MPMRALASAVGAAPAAPGLFCNWGHHPSGARSLPGSLWSSGVWNLGVQRPGTGPGPFSPADGGVALLPPPCRLPVPMLGRLGLGAGMGAGQPLSLEGSKWGFWGGEAAPLLGTQGQMVPSQLGKGTPGWPSALWVMAARPRAGMASHGVGCPLGLMDEDREGHFKRGHSTPAPLAPAPWPYCSAPPCLSFPSQRAAAQTPSAWISRLMGEVWPCVYIHVHTPLCVCDSC